MFHDCSSLSVSPFHTLLLSRFNINIAAFSSSPSFSFYVLSLSLCVYVCWCSSCGCGCFKTFSFTLVYNHLSRFLLLLALFILLLVLLLLHLLLLLISSSFASTASSCIRATSPSVRFAFLVFRSFLRTLLSFSTQHILFFVSATLTHSGQRSPDQGTARRTWQSSALKSMRKQWHALAEKYISFAFSLLVFFLLPVHSRFPSSPSLSLPCISLLYLLLLLLLLLFQCRFFCFFFLLASHLQSARCFSSWLPARFAFHLVQNQFSAGRLGPHQSNIERAIVVRLGRERKTNRWERDIARAARGRERERERERVRETFKLTRMKNSQRMKRKVHLILFEWALMGHRTCDFDFHVERTHRCEHWQARCVMILL